MAALLARGQQGDSRRIVDLVFSEIERPSADGDWRSEITIPTRTEQVTVISVECPCAWACQKAR